MSEQCQPSFSSLLVTVAPSTTSSEIPLPVRTAVVTKSARAPLVMNVLPPLTTKCSPSRCAAVRIAATSEPVSGSVMASAPIFSPARVGRTYRSIRPGLPDATMCGSAMPCVNRAAARPAEPPAWISSSVTTTVSSRSPPEPPTSSGNPIPSNPRAAAVLWSSRGTSPARSQARPRPKCKGAASRGGSRPARRPNSSAS